MQFNFAVPKVFVASFVILALMSSTSSLDNGLALTPPMGFMSWERYRCITDCVNYPDECISERLFHNVADLMVSEGYLDKGYEYVIIDDCWLADVRDAEGNLQPDPDRFPNGIKNLSDYIHSKGLKFGIYEDYGTKTCQGLPGIYGHLKNDAIQFAKWGVDYIKIDGCNVNTSEMDTGYPEFGHYLNETGRPIVYSCSWPAYLEEIQVNILIDRKKPSLLNWRCVDYIKRFKSPVYEAEAYDCEGWKGSTSSSSSLTTADDIFNNNV